MEWLKRIGGVAVIGLIWAAVWMAVGALIGIVDRGGSLDALWMGPAIGMQPGFVAGLLFSAVLGVVASRRRLDSLSFSKVIACGGMAALLGAASAAGSLALTRRVRR